MIALQFFGCPSNDRMQNAGYLAEKQLAFYLDRAFGEEAYIHLFHGLRVERQGNFAQIDHLILHRFGFVLVESKSITESVSINEHGEFARSYRGRWQGMPSPLAQARRQADLLNQLLNDHKTRLRPIVGVGPIKAQAYFGSERFNIVAAISDRGQIQSKGIRPSEIMKAEAVVDFVQKKIDYQQSLRGLGAAARSLLAEFTNKEKAREWDKNLLHPFKNNELETISDFLKASHQPATRLRPTQSRIKASNTDTNKTDKSVSPSKVRAAIAEKKVLSRRSSVPQSLPNHKNESRNMKRWTQDEEEQLRRAFSQGKQPEQLASTFARTPKALRLRAVKMRLITDVSDW